ncbi:uncharacterized protein LOC126830595 [Patella vulgata]|uniref:uncharacterized protein LOC126830595 n=1 Tax=Patella vulgata TaxID=6465 RepID=UPI0024A98818|nr:uncharacterized protein LOC126830595 [Patella vulgata]
MVVTVLKKRHSLKGINPIPLVRRIREGATDVGELARLQLGERTENVGFQEIQTGFRMVTGEKIDDILGMAGKGLDEASARLALHHTIIYGNEVGQPKGQILSEPQCLLTDCVLNSLFYFVIKRCEDKLICPVYAIELYLSSCRLMGVNLSNGYLFRIVSDSGTVLDNPVTYSVVYERLRLYLSTLGIYQSETPHSFRSGCALTLALSDPDDDSRKIMDHCDWFTEGSAGIG